MALVKRNLHLVENPKTNPAVATTSACTEADKATVSERC